MPPKHVVRNLPWQVVLQATYAFRRLAFAREPEAVTHLAVEAMDPDDLRKLLLSRGLVKGDLASYYYYGEEVNMVRGLYKDDEYEWYQYHVRGFDEENGMRLRPHTELYWRVYPKEHIQLVNVDVEEGIELTKAALDDGGFDYEVVPGEGSSTDVTQAVQ
ncbi:hypothetical protein BRC81_17340 [Halobacteriales archaeon QS_1_68_20]|nr:MAG: hypothetical protein BRC81_17340 [Halobacteriales archaeon QS_1_68_20]